MEKKSNTMNNKKRNIILICTAAAVVLILPWILTTDYQIMVMNKVLIYTVVVLGLNFITGLTGQMNLGTAGMFALGAYATAVAATSYGISPWIGLVLAIVMGLLVGRGLGYPSLRLKGVYLALTTIGFSEVVRLVAANWVSVTGGTTGIRNIPYYSLAGYVFDTQTKMYYLFAVFVAFGIFCAYRLADSKWGRIFKSLRDNADAVEMSGVNIASCKILAFTVCAIYGCIAGALYAHFMGYINPSSFTIDLSTNFVIMLMVGGLGSVVGNIFGAAVVTILPEILRVFENYYQLIFCTIVLVGAIFFPEGWMFAGIKVIRKMVKKLRKREHITGEMGGGE